MEGASSCQSDRKPAIKICQPCLSLALILLLPSSILVGTGLPVEKFLWGGQVVNNECDI